MNPPAFKGAFVEIIEYGDPDGICVFPNMVRINGTDVGIFAENGVDTRTGPGGIVELRLTLLPSRIEFKREALPPKGISS